MILPIALYSVLENALGRFPKTFDKRLQEGLQRVVINAPKDFIANRSSSHLLQLLVIQFFLQNKIETAMTKGNCPFFVRLFPKHAHLCVLLTTAFSEDEYVMGKSYLLKAIQRLVPATQEVKGSCFRWFHPDLPYMCLYLEMQKLRGRSLSSKEVRLLNNTLEEQLSNFFPVYTPALFWPFNEEEAYKQIQILLKEVHHAGDLPQVTIYFRQQLKFELEFLVNLVRPHVDMLIDQAAQRLPASVSFFYHFFQKIGSPFPLEAWCFSLTIPAHPFYDNDAINLLYARRYIARYVEELVGPFRDFNGGLLEKQKEKFASLKMRLAEAIPDFHLFAEKVLYALQPIETRLSLTFKEAARLLKAFSRMMKEESPFKTLKDPEGVLVVKTSNFSSLLPLINRMKELEEDVAYAQIILSGFHYLCILDRKNIHLSELEQFLQVPVPSLNKPAVLRLTFQEGRPPSLNPHYVFGDMRCRVLSKLLFEGLTRIDANGMAGLAAAKKMSCSQDGLTYTFTLRLSNWSNGEKVTAFHFLNSWRSILQNPNLTSFWESLFVIKNAQKFIQGQCSLKKLGIYAHDAETLEIQIEWPDPTFLHKLAQPMFFPTMGIAQEPQWFNGPYLIQNQGFWGMRLEGNPYYWDYPRIFFKRVQIEWTSDIESSYALFKKGQIDWIGNPLCKFTSEMVSQLQKEKKLKRQAVARALWMYLNTKCQALSSPKIRQALSAAIDRSAISEQIYPCNDPLYKPLPLSISLCRTNLSDSNSVQSKQLFEMGLRELGFSRKTFPILTVSYPNVAGYKQLAEYLQETWEQILKIRIRLEVSEWNLFRSHLEKGEFQMALSGAASLYPDPSELLERFESSKTANFSQWQHPLYTEKLHLAKNIPQKRMQLLREAEELLLKEMPIIPLCNFSALYAHRPKLKGYVLDHNGCVDFRWAYLEDFS